MIVDVVSTKKQISSIYIPINKHNRFHTTNSLPKSNIESYIMLFYMQALSLWIKFKGDHLNESYREVIFMYVVLFSYCNVQCGTPI